MPSHNKLRYRLLAPISPKHRDRLNYLNLPEGLRQALKATVSSDDEKLVFVKNSKAGCTAITQLIHLYSRGSYSKNSIHRCCDDFRQGKRHWKRNLELIRAAKPITFSFIRHPETRFLSAFKDFFLKPKNYDAPKHLAAIRKFGFSEEKKVGEKLDSFLAYLRDESPPGELSTDRHFRHQTLNLSLEFIDYDFIGRLESLEPDLITLFESVRAPSSFLTRLDNIDAFNASEKSAELTLTNSQRQEVKALYAVDYALYANQSQSGSISPPHEPGDV